MKSLRTALGLSLALTFAACNGAVKSGSYLVTVRDATTGKVVEGITVTAAAATRLAPVFETATDADGEAVIAVGAWGRIDLKLSDGVAQDTYYIAQDRVAVNGGTASVNPTTLIVGGKNGSTAVWTFSITRIERGAAVDK
ncbi:MAG: hypothetical protein DWH96_08815 [Planctomycetota bacterium]|nr:MAG: hypothetical protein DWH96_08815 [Planctomycetota bacterium]